VTLLIHLGVVFESGDNDDRDKEFSSQLSVCQLQLALEQNLTRIAESRGSSILIMDFGQQWLHGFGRVATSH
jgi:hypothetical protein